MHYTTLTCGDVSELHTCYFAHDVPESWWAGLVPTPFSFPIIYPRDRTDIIRVCRCKVNDDPLRRRSYRCEGGFILRCDVSELQFIRMDFVPPAHHDTYPSVDPAIADMVGKVVLITGASRGIGKAMSIAFAQAGASGIVLLARSDLSIVKTACEGAKRPGRSLQVVTIATDITKTADVVAAAEQVKQDLGRLDVLINNAGYMENVACSFGDYDPDEWWRSFTVNLRGTYEVTRAFLPLLLECGGDKTIVNVTSIAAHMTDEIMSAYKVTLPIPLVLCDTSLKHKLPDDEACPSAPH